MSQVKFKSTYQGRPVEVMAGWDRPLGRYFMTVFDLDPEAEKETIWSTLDHILDGGHTDPTGGLFEQLHINMGIDAPKDFWTHVEKREGNVSYVYQSPRRDTGSESDLAPGRIPAGGTWVRREI